MKLNISKEWLMAKIAAEPDDASCEAGVAHPEAPNRFYISHGIIHDKLTGKHVRACDCVLLDGGAEDACALLNDLAGPFNSKQGGIPVPAKI